MAKDQTQSASPRGDYSEEILVPVIEEDVTAGAKPIKTGAVRVDKHVEKRLRTIETPLMHENIEIRRVPVNRVVTETPGIRKQGEMTIIPVVEEELVISKRLIVREEIHVIRHRTKDRFVKEVTLNRESAEVHRLDAEGRIVDRDARHEVAPRRRRRSLLA